MRARRAGVWLLAVLSVAAAARAETLPPGEPPAAPPPVEPEPPAERREPEPAGGYSEEDEELLEDYEDWLERQRRRRRHRERRRRDYEDDDRRDRRRARRYDDEEWEEPRAPRRRRGRDLYDDYDIEPRDPNRGKHTHDGFHLHLGTSFGWFDAAGQAAVSTLDPGSTDNSLVELRAGGLSSGFDVEVGGSPTHDFVLYGKLAVALANNIGERDERISAELVTMGGGMSLWLGEPNVKLSADVSLANVIIMRRAQLVGDSNDGIYVEIGAAKEFWVTRNWGMGVQLDLGVGRVPGLGGGDPWRIAVASLGFSATYQ